MHDIKLVLRSGHTFSPSNIIMHRPRDWQRAFSSSHAHLRRLSCTSLLVGNIGLEVTDKKKPWTCLSPRRERNAVLDAVDETLGTRKLLKRKGWQITPTGKRERKKWRRKMWREYNESQANVPSAEPFLGGPIKEAWIWSRTMIKNLFIVSCN